MHKKVGIVYDPRFALHLTGETHPEAPERIVRIEKALRNAFLLTDKNLILPRLASFEELSLAHSTEYIRLVEKEASSCQSDEIKYLSTGDVVISNQSFEIACLAVGGMIEAIDAVFSHKFSSVFCIVRPPGHHASRSIGMGFCLFNNVVIGALFALKKYSIQRVLIVDWDVHHGNGTEELIKENPNIFYFSTHQFPLWPGTGKESERGCGNIINIPLQGGSTSRKAILDAYAYQLTAAMEIFKPELILISAGFDAHKQDPLGGLELESEDFGTLTDVVKEIAARFSSGRMVSVLEGGYNLDALAASAVAHVRSLA